MRMMRVFLLALLLGTAASATPMPSVMAPLAGAEAHAQVRVRRGVRVVARPTVVVRPGGAVYVRRSYGTYYGIGGVIAFLVVLSIIGYFILTRMKPNEAAMPWWSSTMRASPSGFCVATAIGRPATA